MTSNVPLYLFLRVRRDGIDDILTFAMSRGHRHSAPPVSSITGNGNPAPAARGGPGPGASSSPCLWGTRSDSEGAALSGPSGPWACDSVSC